MPMIATPKIRGFSPREMRNVNRFMLVAVAEVVGKWKAFFRFPSFP